MIIPINHHLSTDNSLINKQIIINYMNGITNNNVTVRIEQILPDYITMPIPVKKAICAVVEKKETGKFLDLLKQRQFLIDKVHLISDEEKSNCLKEFQRSVIQHKENVCKYKLSDCSFLKRVKNAGNNKNYVIITFIDELRYLNKTIDECLSELSLSKENIIEISLPSMQPISSNQFESAKQIWPITSLISPKEKFLYEHKEKEKEEVISLFNQLKEDNQFTSYLYSPITKQIIAKGKEDNSSCIHHSIMDLLDNYCKSISRPLLLGEKNEEAPKENTNTLFGYEEQYYCEGLYVLSIKEPCVMCAMALVHNRINRIYYEKENEEEGGLISQIKINNYKLNHYYHIFNIIYEQKS